MSRASSSLAAFSMAGMSDCEPIRIPTRALIRASSWSWWRGSEPPGEFPPEHASAQRESCGDVPAHCLAVEVDHVRGSIRGAAGGPDVLAEGCHVQHAPAGGDDRAVALGRARVRDL